MHEISKQSPFNSLLKSDSLRVSLLVKLFHKTPSCQGSWWPRTLKQGNWIIEHTICDADFLRKIFSMLKWFKQMSLFSRTVIKVELINRYNVASFALKMMFWWKRLSSMYIRYYPVDAITAPSTVWCSLANVIVNTANILFRLGKAFGKIFEHIMQISLFRLANWDRQFKFSFWNLERKSQFSVSQADLAGAWKFQLETGHPLILGTIKTFPFEMIVSEKN